MALNVQPISKYFKLLTIPENDHYDNDDSLINEDQDYKHLWRCWIELRS